MLWRLIALLIALIGVQGSYAFHKGIAVTTTLGLGLNRGEVPVAPMSIAAPFTSRREHFSHPDGSISSCQTVDVGWYVDPTNPNADARTIKRYIEYPANIFTQVTWNGGATSVTIAPGSVVKSDVFTISVPSLTKLWERTVNLNATVTNFPVQEVSVGDTNSGLGLDDGNISGDFGNSGTIAATADIYSFGAAAFVCTINTPNARSFAITGDSIAFGNADTSIGSHGGLGYVEKMLDVHGYPYARYAKPSLKASDLVSNISKPQAFFAALSFSDAIQQLGINDLTLGSESVATVLADHQTIYGLFGSAHIFQTTLLPVTTSSDFWTTTSGQTFNSPTNGTLGSLNTLNDTIRTPPANVFRVLDAADVAMTSRDSDIWIAPPQPTPDGIHPIPPMSNTLATSLAPHL